MNLSYLIQKRKSCRAFLNEPIDTAIIHHILDIARWAPSGVNHQPTKVAVLLNESKDKLSKALIEKFQSGLPANPDYDYCPKDWSEVYTKRRKSCGLALYQSLAIDVDDKESKKKHWEQNYYFFHAPVGLIIYIEKNMPKGSWVDVGMFIQNILLAAETFNLSTCAQAAIAEYPDVIRDVLSLENVDIVCGIALGYADSSHPINSYRIEREPVNAFTKWYD